MDAVRQKDDVYKTFMINILCLQHLRHQEFLATQFRIGPVFDGHALTIANTLRRSLLCEINAAAIICAFFPNNEHEYEQVPGVQETVHDVLFNLKKVKLKSDFTLFPPQKAVLDFLGPGCVSAGDIELPGFLTCVNAHFALAHVTEKAHFRVELLIGSGHGSVAPLADEHKGAFREYVTAFQSLQKQSQKTTRPAFKRNLARNVKAPSWVGHDHALTLQDLNVAKPGAPRNHGFKRKPGRLWRLRSKFSSLSLRSRQRPKRKKRRLALQPAFASKRDVQGHLGFEPTSRLTSKLRSQICFHASQASKVKAQTSKVQPKPLVLPPVPRLETRGYFIVPSVFSPIVRVNYRIEDDPTSQIPMEHIFMEIWSNGSLKPTQALQEAASATMNLFAPFQKRQG